MGMFDDVKVEVPLPDGAILSGFQTKDFDCLLDAYTIRADGELWREVWSFDEPGRMERVDFHGRFRFYTFSDESNAMTSWHEYEAKFTDGKLVEITVLKSPLVEKSPTP